METRNDENPERVPAAPAAADGNEIIAGKATPAAGPAAGDAADEETDAGLGGAVDKTDPAAPGDSGTPPDPVTDGDTDKEPGGDGSDNGSDGDDPDGDGGEPEGDGEPDEPRPFEERFLNNGATGEATPAERRESLAASLIRMALALLTGEVPEERFIPLMDAVIAHEAVLQARAEGEIAGRNAIIEEQLATPAIAPPDLNGTPIARSRRPATSIFDLADLAR